MQPSWDEGISYSRQCLVEVRGFPVRPKGAGMNAVWQRNSWLGSSSLLSAIWTICILIALCFIDACMIVP